VRVRGRHLNVGAGFAPRAARATPGGVPVIERLFAGFPRGRVLDFGGGDGAVAAVLQRLGHEVTVIDVDASALAEARRRGLDARCGDERALDGTSERWDHSLLSHVVEHVQCPHETLVPRIHNVVAERGKVVVAVPNAARLRNRAGLLLGRFSDGMVYQHVRFFTRGTLRDELARGGLRVVRELAHSYGPLTRLAACLSPGFGDDLIVVAERPPGPPRAIPVSPGWTHR
jgi:2-polyprenyl-3-methyl-5-hydroxy-6-metoxy-1,4-benzoquinol methylase